MAQTAHAGTVRHKLQIHFDAREYRLSAEVAADLADDCDTLARAVGNFPQADLRVVIERNGRDKEFATKLTLILPGRTFATSDHDGAMHAAFRRSLASLSENVRAYKDELGRVPERRRADGGTDPGVVPGTAADEAALLAAADAGDYPAFRAAIAPYEDAVRVRAGRWVERRPEIQARMGRGLDPADVAEDVFLTAFEGYADRPPAVPLGEWLESLLDPATQALARHPDEELENINMARAACEARPRPNPT